MGLDELEMCDPACYLEIRQLKILIYMKTNILNIFK